MTLLTAKQRRGGPAAQVQTLVRIARRATCHAEWIATFLGNPAYQEPGEQASLRADIEKSEAKALAATMELAQIVAEHPEYPHWTLAQKAAAARFLREERAK